MDNGVSKEYCKEHSKVIDERFERDKTDIEKHEKAIDDIKQLSIEISQLVKQHDNAVKNHEVRIDTLEHKPSAWFDRIISWAVGAFIAALVAAILSGNVKF